MINEVGMNAEVMSEKICYFDGMKKASGCGFEVKDHS